MASRRYPAKEEGLISLSSRTPSQRYPRTSVQAITEQRLDWETFLEIVAMDSVKTKYDFSRPLCEEFLWQADTGLGQARSDL